MPRGKKVPKETRPAVCDPHAARGGTPGVRRWRGALRNSLRACGATLKQPQRVSSRSMRDFAHATPPPPRPRRSLKGGGDDTGHRCARPPTRRRCAPRVPGRAQRWPVCGLQTPSGRTEERRAWGGRVCRPGQPGGLRAACQGFAVDAPAQAGRRTRCGGELQALVLRRDVGVQRDDGARRRRLDAHGRGRAGHRVFGIRQGSEAFCISAGSYAIHSKKRLLRASEEPLGARLRGWRRLGQCGVTGCAQTPWAPRSPPP